MRLRKCKNCGKEFAGQGEQRLCLDCRKAAQRATVILPRTCATCGKIFDGGPRAKYCPECRAERARWSAAKSRERKRAGKTRPIGSIDICEVCGNEYVVSGSLQRYCPACAEEAVRSNVLPAKRERAAQHLAELTARKKALKEDSAVCAYCGKTYTPTGPNVTCSEECAREYLRIVRGMADYKRGRLKAPPSHERYSSGLPQSPLTGVSYNRGRGKWQVSHNGKYIGLFATQEEAEAKKRELQQLD